MFLLGGIFYLHVATYNASGMKTRLVGFPNREKSESTASSHLMMGEATLRAGSVEPANRFAKSPNVWSLLLALRITRSRPT